MRIGPLTAVPALGHPELVAAPVGEALAAWAHGSAVGVVAIPPELADTSALMEAYGLPHTSGANCVVVAGRRQGEERIAACVVRSDHRADVNGLVKRTLDVRSASFLPRERALQLTRMQYGGITPFGLPGGWRVLVDPSVLEIDVAILGSGIRGSKLLLPGRLMADLPAVEILEGLGS